MRNIIGKQGFVSTRGETDKFDTIVETDTYFVSGNKLFLGNIDVEAALLSGSGGGGSGSANPGGVNTQLNTTTTVPSVGFQHSDMCLELCKEREAFRVA